MTSLDDSALGPWLDFANLRVARADLGLSASLSFEANASRVGLVGDFRALFAALDRSGNILAGYGNIAGAAVELAVQSGQVGLALADIALPPTLTAEEYLQHSARLTGLPKALATQAARQTLNNLGLHALAQRRLGSLTPYERRALLVSHASLGNPRALCLEAPLARLDPASQNFVRSVLERAASGRLLVVSVRDLSDPAERDLLSAMQQVLARTVDGTINPILALTLSKSSDRNYSVIVAQGADALITALAARGCTAQISGDAGALKPLLRLESQAHAQRLNVELPADAEPSLVVEAAIAAEVLVLELLPANA